MSQEHQQLRKDAESVGNGTGWDRMGQVFVRMVILSKDAGELPDISELDMRLTLW